MVIDDQMENAGGDKRIVNLFTRGSHHRNLSVIYILQNLFHQGKNSRSISLKSHYLVLFKNPRDKLQILTLAKQMYPGQTDFFIKRYEEAVRRPFGYLLVDLKTTTQYNCRLRTNVLSGEERFHNVGVPDNIAQELLKYLKQQNLATARVLPVMEKLKDSMDGLLSRTDLGEYERARQYMQLQNKYLTFKQQLNSRHTESSLPYSEGQQEMSSNLLADNVPAPIQEPVAVTVNPVKEPVTDVQAVAVPELPVQATTIQTPVSFQATPAKVFPPSFILTPPPAGEARSQRKRKRPRIWFVNYLEEDDRPSRRSRRLRKSHPYKYFQEEED